MNDMIIIILTYSSERNYIYHSFYRL